MSLSRHRLSKAECEANKRHRRSVDCNIGEPFTTWVKNWPAEWIRPPKCPRGVVLGDWRVIDTCDAATIADVQARCRDMHRRIESGRLVSAAQFFEALPCECLAGMDYARKVELFQTTPIRMLRLSPGGLLHVCDPEYQSLHQVMPTALESLWPRDYEKRQTWIERMSAIVPDDTELRLAFDPQWGLPRRYHGNAGDYLLATVTLPDGRDLAEVFRSERC